jgi:hypothetical protein
MTSAFKKGQAVTLFSSWDDKGTIYYRQAVVYSCGQKQMVLTDALTGKEIGRNFRPVVASGAALGTRPRMTDDDAAALCLDLAAAYLADQKASMEHSIAHYARGESDPYTQAMRRGIAALHEPRSLRHPG